MPTIDSGNIENFASMTAEEQVKALLSYEFDDGAAKLKEAEEKAAKQKAALDKAASEAANYKKQLNAKLSDEERVKQENDEVIRAMQEKLAEYELRDKVSTAKAAFLGGGFDEESAKVAADAFVNADIEKMSTALKTYRESIEKAAKAKLMGESPKPDGGYPDDSDSGKDDATKIAETLGNMRAEQNKTSRAILDKYIKGGNS